MREEQLDESSHYEISLTAAQALVAFVLLLFSLSAAFAFGIMIGRGTSDDRLVVRTEQGVVKEASIAKRGEGRIVELGNPRLDEEEDELLPVAQGEIDLSVPPSLTTEKAAPETTTGDAVINEMAEPVPAPASQAPQAASASPPTEAVPQATPAVPHFVQLMSTTDARGAESLAAKLIESGFSSAYVERVHSDKGMVHRVRVRFATEADARAAVQKLRPFAKTDPWVTKQ